ncbi:hypothetical protein ACFLYO_08050 [Chloroflexota bacterium]
MQESSLGRFFWPLLIIALGAVAILLAWGAMPPALADLINRAWSIVLVLIGLVFIFDMVPRLRRFAPLVAVLVCVLLLGGIVTFAYSSRAATQRTENVVQVQEPVAESVEALRVIIAGQTTNVEISPALAGDNPTIIAQFIGSAESQIESSYVVADDGTATFTMREVRPAGLPLLEAVGSGQMRVEIPAGLPVDLDFSNTQGTVSLNLLGLELLALRTHLDAGDLLLSLPDKGLDGLAEVMVQQGAVTVFVPEDLGLQVSTGGRTPQYEPGAYLKDESQDAYLSREFDDLAETITLSLTVGGDIRLE